MQKLNNKKLLAAVDDLFFTVKIADAAKRAGMVVEFVKSQADLFAKASDLPSLVIFDLNFGGIQPLKAISQMKADDRLKAISLIGYVSHVQADLKQQAQESGCDMVLARSAFSQNLAQILKRHSGSY
jgi:CheY-like chemotaxis protein